jgi:hypothetical protein
MSPVKTSAKAILSCITIHLKDLDAGNGAEALKRRIVPCFRVTSQLAVIGPRQQNKADLATTGRKYCARIGLPPRAGGEQSDISDWPLTGDLLTVSGQTTPS